MCTVRLSIITALLLSWAASPTGDARCESIAARQESPSLAVPFLENRGQLPAEVRFHARTFAGNVFVTSTDIAYALHGSSAPLRERPIGAENFVPRGEARSPVVVSSYLGARSNWQMGIPAFERVVIPSIWQKIDLSLERRGNNLEKVFSIDPGGDPRLIRLFFDRADSL